ncbi:5-bromo-4-chloroindolyl phosphate hydrolysis family protein [Oscillibacter sp.]|uniref:5-bromo-4-chloroindolyl phosphate hydrolysis family protein n=1 Tax=Oscillibacter sp. TaxID=1945593 RepID=UPI0033912385
MTIHKSVAPFYAVAVAALGYALFFPLYQPAHFALLTAIALAVFFGVTLLCKGAASNAAAAEKKAEEKPAEEKPTGNAELDKALKDGRLALAEMRRLDDNIADPGISADIVRLEQVSQKIFDFVKEHPDKLPQIRKFMDYYLPTTLKLLNSYDRAASAGVEGENINSLLTKVEGMMRTIVAAFEKQLDSLFGSENLDISTDITVLETMMAREGLVGDQLHAQTNPPDGDIKLDL